MSRVQGDHRPRSWGAVRPSPVIRRRWLDRRQCGSDGRPGPRQSENSLQSISQVSRQVAVEPLRALYVRIRLTIFDNRTQDMTGDLMFFGNGGRSKINYLLIARFLSAIALWKLGMHFWSWHSGCFSTRTHVRCEDTDAYGFDVLMNVDLIFTCLWTAGAIVAWHFYFSNKTKTKKRE